LKAHQRIIREHRAAEDSDADMFGRWWDGLDVSPERAELREVDHRTAMAIIDKYEWLGTYCNAPLAAFGIYWDGNCGGVVAYGAPSPPNVATSALGEGAKFACQLARGACTHWAHEHAASKLISFSLREMGTRGYGLAIAYSDPVAGEVGTVYQASNWTYCGLTAKRPDYFDATGTRQTGHFQTEGLTRSDRPRKHRYVKFLGPRYRQRSIRKMLRWPVISEYPKRGPSIGRADSNLCEAGATPAGRSKPRMQRKEDDNAE